MSMVQSGEKGRGLRVVGALLVVFALGLGGWWVLRGPAQEGEGKDVSAETSKQDKERFVRGLVLDRETGARVAGAKVTLRGAEGGTVSVKATRRGVFRFDAEALGLVKMDGGGEVMASAPKYAKSLEWTRVEVGVDAKVYLEQRGVVEGRVTAQGAGIEGARVSVLRLASGVEDEGDAPEGGGAKMGDEEVLTDAEGRFSMRLKPGRVRLLVEAEGRGLGESREVVVRGGATVRKVLVDLTERGGLRVVAVDMQGKPVSGARVEFVGRATWEVPEASTGPDGVAEVDGVPQGTARVRLRAAGFAVSEVVSVDVTAEDVMEVRIPLQPLEGISGRVVTPKGRGVRFALVVLSTQDGSQVATESTDVDGVFRFEGVDDGVYLVKATHARFGPSEQRVVRTDERSNLELMLTEGGSIQGAVYDAEGNPVSQATLVVERFTPTQGDADMSKLSARNFPRRNIRSLKGEFTFANLAAGSYDLYVDAGDLGQGGVRGVVVRASEVTSGVRIDLDSGVLITGRVIDAQTGQPVAGAAVSMRDLARTQRRLRPRNTRTDSDGAFTFQGVAAGRRSVTISKQGYITKVRAGLEITSRTTSRTLELELEPLAEGQAPQMEFFGIGAVLEPTSSGSIAVRSTLENAPGSMAGLQKGDEIIRVDDQDASSLGLRRAVEMIRGEEGTQVILKVKRQGDPHPFDVVIDRGRVVYSRK